MPFGALVHESLNGFLFNHMINSCTAHIYIYILVTSHDLIVCNYIECQSHKLRQLLSIHAKESHHSLLNKF